MIDAISPGARRAFVGIALCFTIVVVPMITWQMANDALGSDTTGEVINIHTNTSGRRVYTVRFVTGSGQMCESRIDSGSNPPPGDVAPGGGLDSALSAALRRAGRNLGERVDVHHPLLSPCLNVHESEGTGRWTNVAIILAMLAAIGTLGYKLWRTTSGHQDPPRLLRPR